MKISALCGPLGSKGKLHVRRKEAFASLWTKCDAWRICPGKNQYFLILRGAAEQARLAALAATQVHQQNIDNLGRATNPDDEDLDDDELLNPMRADEVAAPVNRRDCQARMRPDRRAVQVLFDDDDDDLDRAGATGAIIPPPLAPRAKFNITSTMIQLLHLKGLFGGLAGDDRNMHLINFISTCKSFGHP
ncbi:hypothetical protein CQW23_14122 [Capsicum baccatum]|uniref:Uncharacterized protein n=1 Tax=Capsicum baccatum TaxID=33114 RepID=A0A2G2WI99_CAPBA|nr:hypothetical protein CQW23_14122 [Capsicum baccatum]